MHYFPKVVPNANVEVLYHKTQHYIHQVEVYTCQTEVNPLYTAMRHYSGKECGSHKYKSCF